MRFKNCAHSITQVLTSAVAVSLLMLTSSVLAATITVNTTNDIDLVSCTLRDAITAANTDTITNGCAAGDATQDTINFSVNGTINLGSALSSLSSNITLSGPGSANLIISGGGSTVINVSGTGVIISGLTLTGGSSGSFGGGLWVTGSGVVDASDLVITGNSAADGGGVANGGSLVLTDSSVTNNTANASSFGGGGIYNSGILTLSNVSITNNSTSNNGGGVFNHAAGTLDISDSTVSNNSVGVEGGGIHNVGTISNFTGNVVASNTGASSGGGLYIVGNATISQSTIASNTASDSGGGIFGQASITLVDSSITSNTSTNFGGGVNASAITVTRSLVSGNSTGTAGGGLNALSYTITDSTLSNNSATTAGFGGAAYLGGGSMLTLVNSTVTGNSATAEGGGIWSAGTVNFTNSIIAGNTATNCQGPGVAEVWNSNGYNIESANTCQLNNTGDQINTNPMLAPLQDNGGPTLTHALLTGSPAIDMANNANCTTTDQRGALRPQDGNNDTVATCDVGAYEVGDLPTTGGNFGSGKCFIATAAYGTAMAKDVRYLRAFRDQYLLKNTWGKSFVNWYYEVSPAMADKLRKHNALRGVVRGMLTPLVWMSKGVVDEKVYQQQTEHHP